MTTAVVAKPTGVDRFEVQEVRAPPGLARRALTVNRHLIGLGLGGIVAHARSLDPKTSPVHRWAWRFAAAIARPFVRKDLVDCDFAFQFRRRLELLGPTYIKLGQILSLREDILPPSVTTELRHLLNQLPVISFADFRDAVEQELGRQLDRMFAWVDPHPLASASIAQIHRATLHDGTIVVIKLVKPGVTEILERDAKLLGALGAALQIVLSRYQPRRIITEFCAYTLREIDLRREADNAETFAVNFRDMRDVSFPTVYRDYSSRRVLTMEFLDGERPDSAEAVSLSEEARDHLVDVGAASIIRMIYRDGFFHADLHPGNLLILAGPRVGFIDLGMVGRLDPELRRALLYYYYSLVTGDAENAARYLTAVAVPGGGADPAGFRRDVAEISSRWHLGSSFDTFSLAQLILESLQRGAAYRMYFPVELVLMVKALITFEGVGNVLRPGFDVADVSRRHIRRVFLEQFSPLRIAREELRGAPDLIDALVKLPSLVTEGVRVLERSTRPATGDPLAGVRATVLGGSFIMSAAILLALHGPWPVWAALFGVGTIAALRRGS